jgi:hypothetical protein
MEDVSFYIDLIASSGRFTSVCFSGGEPFSREELLRHAVSCASLKGLSASAMTSAFWAGSPEKAYETLLRFKELKELHISCDEYHREFVPDSYVRNAIEAARKTGLWAVTVNVTSSQQQHGKEVISTFSDLIPATHITWQETVPAGRGRGLPAECLNLGRSETPCEDIEYKAIDTRGYLTACCGPVYELPESHPLILGDLRKESLQELHDRENIIFDYLRYKGPWSLASLLEKAGVREFSGSWMKGCACDLCVEILGDRSSTDALQRILLAEHAEELRFFNSFLKKVNMLQQ